MRAIGVLLISTALGARRDWRGGEAYASDGDCWRRPRLGAESSGPRFWPRRDSGRRAWSDGSRGV